MLTNHEGNRKLISCVMLIILLSTCIHTACGYANDENSESETEVLLQMDTSVTMQDTKKVDSLVDGIESEQVVFTEEDLPEVIRKLLSYENWINSTQAVSCTKEDIQESELAEVFQQILCGDFSSVLVLRTEEEREEMQEEYQRRENWEFRLMDMDGDDIDELCIKDSKGKLGIFDEFYGGVYLPGRIEYWTFGEPGDDLLISRSEWGMNYFFLNNKTIFSISKDVKENNIYFSLWLMDAHVYESVGAVDGVGNLNIRIVNNINTEFETYEEQGIYYKLDNTEITEAEAVAWCENNINPYMAWEEEWFTVP